MGRKKKEKVGSFDRIGEEVNLEKCRSVWSIRTVLPGWMEDAQP